MYTLPHLKRVQDYLLSNVGLSFYIFHNPADKAPEFAGPMVDLEFRTSPYIQRGSLLVLDKDGIHKALVERLALDDDAPTAAVEHQIFGTDDTVDMVIGDSLADLAGLQ